MMILIIKLLWTILNPSLKMTVYQTVGMYNFILSKIIKLYIMNETKNF